MDILEGAGIKAEVLPPLRGETDIIREEITLAMVMAGVGAHGEWEEKRECGHPVTLTDLVSTIYASMRQISAR